MPGAWTLRPLTMPMARSGSGTGSAAAIRAVAIATMQARWFTCFTSTIVLCLRRAHALSLPWQPDLHVGSPRVAAVYRPADVPRVARRRPADRAADLGRP